MTLNNFPYFSCYLWGARRCFTGWAPQPAWQHRIKAWPWEHERNSYTAREFGVDGTVDRGAGGARASLSGLVSGRRHRGPVGGATPWRLLQPHERIITHPGTPLFAGVDGHRAEMARALGPHRPKRLPGA